MSEAYHLAVAVQAADDLSSLLTKYSINQTVSRDEVNPVIVFTLEKKGGRNAVNRYKSLVRKYAENAQHLRKSYG